MAPYWIWSEPTSTCYGGNSWKTIFPLFLEIDSWGISSVIQGISFSFSFVLVICVLSEFILIMFCCCFLIRSLTTPVTSCFWLLFMFYSLLNTTSYEHIVWPLRMKTIPRILKGISLFSEKKKGKIKSFWKDEKLLERMKNYFLRIFSFWKAKLILKCSRKFS